MKAMRFLPCQRFSVVKGKNWKLKLASGVALLMCTLASSAQNYPIGYFQSPLDIPLYLSGNFGELRANHFHTGLDIKTEGKEGLNVYAAAGGWVSRIKVSSVGYGYAVYIDHPNGFTTVYAHLSSYNQRIQDFTKLKHYQKKSFEIDVPVPYGELPITQGEIIGLSGNSGGSGGPHLHFEIRDTKTELALNPLLFGFDIPDDVKPNITAWRAYALNESASISDGASTVVDVNGRHGEYNANHKDNIFVHGEIGFAIHASDMLTGMANKCGVYNIEFYVDDTIVQLQKMEKLDFNKGRYINAHTDYRVFQRSKSNIHKLYLEPGNKSTIYPISKNRGRLNFTDDKPHPIRFVLRDAYGNVSELRDTVYSRSKGGSINLPRIGIYDQLWAWNKRHTPQTPDYVVDFPAENIYKNEYVRVFDRGPLSGFYSNVLELGDNEIPVHGNYTVKLALHDLPDSLRAFAFLAQMSETNRILRSAGNKREGNFIVGTAKSFGHFGIAIDTVSPTISPVNIEEGKEFAAGDKISFTSSDALTGIEKYDLYIDNSWALIAYDAKYDRFTYTIDPEKILPGIHRLQFVASDGVGNSRTFECNFLLR